MLAVILWTIGAFNAVLASHVSTCPNGEADSLAGGAISLFLYCCGGFAVLVATPKRWVFVFALPAILLSVWQSLFALTFSWSYWVDGESACNAMGLTSAAPGTGMDGREPIFTILWCAAMLVFWVGVAAGAQRSLRMANGS